MVNKALSRRIIYIAAQDDCRDQRPWDVRPPTQVPITNNKSQINPKLTICCLSQFKQDTGDEPSMSTQEINPIIYLLQTDVKPRSFHCPCKYSNHWATETDPCLSIRSQKILLIQFFTSTSIKYIIYRHNLTLHSKYTTYQSLSQCLLHQTCLYVYKTYKHIYCDQ